MKAATPQFLCIGFFLLLLYSTLDYSMAKVSTSTSILAISDLKSNLDIVI